MLIVVKNVEYILFRLINLFVYLLYSIQERHYLRICFIYMLNLSVRRKHRLKEAFRFKTKINKGTR